IFERFYRVDKSRSKETGGTGLGLAIVKHIAEIHGAQIELKSEENRGVNISIIF
ncbi:MAG: two-component sensor histidine kinase, partial [Thermoguttaceae bacterium]|nr:two-component sensor histidine kinase [Thermoguttaceae bacterium]